MSQKEKTPSFSNLPTPERNELQMNEIFKKVTLAKKPSPSRNSGSSIKFRSNKVNLINQIKSHLVHDEKYVPAKRNVVTKTGYFMKKRNTTLNPVSNGDLPKI